MARKTVIPFVVPGTEAVSQATATAAAAPSAVSPTETLRRHEEEVAKAYDLRVEDSICEAMVEVLRLIANLPRGHQTIDCGKIARKAGLATDDFVTAANSKLTKFRLSPPAATSAQQFVFTVERLPDPAPFPTASEVFPQMTAPKSMYDDMMDVELETLRLAKVQWKDHGGVYYADPGPGKTWKDAEWWLEPIRSARDGDHIRLRRRRDGHPATIWIRYAHVEPLDIMVRKLMQSFGVSDAGVQKEASAAVATKDTSNLYDDEMEAELGRLRRAELRWTTQPGDGGYTAEIVRQTKYTIRRVQYQDTGSYVCLQRITNGLITQTWERHPLIPEDTSRSMFARIMKSLGVAEVNE
jgi:hypothetical protein